MAHNRAFQAFVVLSLAILALVAYWPISHNGFVDFDDGAYIFENISVRAGLTWDGVRWAFESVDDFYWHPLTWISLMLDTSLFGLDPRGYHYSSLFIHALNAGLLFLFLHRCAGRAWAAALAAALFVLHPVNVDSVAWAAERKTVLSTLFFLLALIAYLEYVEWRSWARYAAALLFMALGLMAKPVLVILPGVLLLLDWWPLNRFWFSPDQGGGLPKRPARTMRLVLEKLPFVALALGSVLLTALTVSTFAAATAAVPFGVRLANALTSAALYLRILAWPADLAVLYPFPMSIPAWQPALATFLLLGLSVGAFVQRRMRPYLLTGWLWFLGALAPVSGLLRIGLWPAMADRFVYVPFIGLFWAVSFALADAAESPGRKRRWAAAAAAFVACAVLVAATRNQVACWKDSETLFAHAIASGHPSVTAYSNLGTAAYRKGQWTEAMVQFQKALEINPDFAPVLNNAGRVLASQDDLPGAEAYFKRAIAEDASFLSAYNNLALIRLRQGEVAAAMEIFDQALAIKPDYDVALVNKGNELLRQGQYAQAEPLYRLALEANPLLPAAHYHLGIVIQAQNGSREEAVGHFRKALALGEAYPELLLRIASSLAARKALDEAEKLYGLILAKHPELAEAHNDYGDLLARTGHPEQALARFAEAVRLDPRLPLARANLGKALLESGDPLAAEKHLEEALALAPGMESAQVNLLRTRALLAR